MSRNNIQLGAIGFSPGQSRGLGLGCGERVGHGSWLIRPKLFRPEALGEPSNLIFGKI